MLDLQESGRGGGEWGVGPLSIFIASTMKVSVATCVNVMTMEHLCVHNLAIQTRATITRLRIYFQRHLRRSTYAIINESNTFTQSL